jgi:DNA-binding MarR family transcriptional regulator
MAKRTDQQLSGESLTYALVDSVFGLASASHAQVADLMAELDITTALANALWKLDPTGPAPSMRDLGTMLRCDPSTVTFIADRLHERDLVTREVDPSNRRVKRLVLTAKGRKVRAKLTEAMTTRSPIAGLTQDEQRQLLALIRKVLPRE